MFIAKDDCDLQQQTPPLTQQIMDDFIRKSPKRNDRMQKVIQK
jgi:hypothetical protein